MIIYNVTVNIDEDVHEEWLDWMQRVHIPDVMNSGMFLEAKISKILAEEEGGLSYAIQYSGKFVAFRTLLKVHGSFEKQ